MAILPGKRLGPFEILSGIGAGGMGEVYRARDTLLDRIVAIKVLPANFVNDPERLSRFEREARMLAALNHANIATIYGLEQSDGAHCLVMEFVSGETLAERLKAGPVGIEEALKIGAQIAQALEAAHEKGIIHRDLKPANVKMTPEGKVKVLDFGLAKAFSRDPPNDDPSNSPTLTTVGSEEGRILGTPAYMSPEQARGQRVDKRSDIWAFGCVLYELLTAQRAFRGETLPDTFAAILEREPDWQALPPSTPAKIRDLLRRTLHKDIQLRLHDMANARIEIEEVQRYASAAELWANLRTVQRGSAGSGPDPVPAVAGRRVRSLAAAVLIVATLGTGVATIPRVREHLRGWLGIGAVPQERQLAVLPFEVVGGEPTAKAFGDGLTETLTAKLTQLTASHAFQVISASEVQAKRVTTADQARKEFGVNLALEGNLRRSGDRVRVNYSLVDARTHRQLSADSITVATSDPFALQDEVVNGALRMLELEVEPLELQSLVTHGTRVPAAYGFYLQGRGYLQNYDKVENLDNAITVFKRALALDPNYALAFTGLGQAYWQKYEESKDTRWVESARQACEGALHLDAELAAAHVCLGQLESGTGEYEKAVKEFEHAVETEPTSDDTYRGLAETYERLGKLAAAEKTYRRAIELRPHYWAGYNWLGAFYYDQARYPEAASMFSQVITLAPDSIRGYSNLGAIYYYQGRYTEAIGMLQRSIAIRPTASAYSNLGSAYFYLRRYDEAAGAYEEAVKLSPSDYLLWWNLADGYYWASGKRVQAAQAYRKAISLAKEALRVNRRDAFALGVLAYCHAMLGERKPALDYLQEGLKLAPENFEMRFKAALVYNQLGDVTQAVDWLQKALAAGFSTTITRDTPNFDPLRSNPRFEALIQAQ